MVFNQDEILLKKFPELTELMEEYTIFKQLQEINKEKLVLIKRYQIEWKDISLKDLKKLFTRLLALTIKDKKEQSVEKVYSLRFLQSLKKAHDESSIKIKGEFREFIDKLELLSQNLSRQIDIVMSDPLHWKLRVNFHDLIQLIVEEQEIIGGEINFLEDLNSQYNELITTQCKKNARKVLCESHRGASGLATENTLESFNIALQTKTDIIEFDVQMCKTGELVVIHNYKVDNLTNGKGRIRDLTLIEIKALKINGASAGSRILQFEEVIDLLKGRRKMYIDLKVYGLADKIKLEIMNKVNTALRQIGVPENQTVFGSFDFNLLKIIKGMRPNSTIFLSFELSDASPASNAWHYLKWKVTSNLTFAGRFVKKAKELGTDSISVPSHLVDKESIEYIHSHDIKLGVFTVNNPYWMMQLIFWGVDLIATDRPDILDKVRASLLNNKVPDFVKIK